jgi:hypothetical protein
VREKGEVETMETLVHIVVSLAFFDLPWIVERVNRTAENRESHYAALHIETLFSIV